MYTYRVTIEVLNRPAEKEPGRRQSVQFNLQNHDDLFGIVKTVHSKRLLNGDKSAALASV